MVVELRKRKAPPTQPEPAQKKTATAKATKKTKAAAKSSKPAAPAKTESQDAPTPESPPAVPTVGDVISLKGFGGEIQTQDGESTTLESLLEASKAGVVLFTYPRASTPGCKLFIVWHGQCPVGQIIFHNIRFLPNHVLYPPLYRKSYLCVMLLHLLRFIWKI